MLLLITQAFIQVLNFRNNRKLMSSTHSSSILSLSSYDKYGIIPPYDFTIRVRSLAPKPFGGSFKNVLFKYLDDPVDNKADIFMETSKFTVIYDAYPKARIHLLILPKRSNFECNGIEFLSSTDIKNIKELHDLARYIAQSIKRQVAERALTTKSSLLSEQIILTGYHSVPSLHPLHCHIISNDFVSDSLKTKRHWNSFTTDFFVDIGKVEESLNYNLMAESNETLATQMGSREDREEILKCPLRCHHIGCSKQFKNMPQLKDHLVSFHS